MLCVFDEIVFFPHLLFVDLMGMNDRGELQVLLDPLQQNIDNPKAWNWTLFTLHFNMICQAYCNKFNFWQFPKHVTQVHLVCFTFEFSWS